MTKHTFEQAGRPMATRKFESAVHVICARSEFPIDLARAFSKRRKKGR